MPRRRPRHNDIIIPLLFSKTDTGLNPIVVYGLGAALAVLAAVEALVLLP